MEKILVIGEILVEIMSDTVGKGFCTAQPLTGPYPSGAPAIFASQVAAFGQPVGIISSVGNDDFGHLNINRLNQDGVDTSAIYIDNDRPTGSAFVRYQEDGSREFIFNIKHSACGQLNKNVATNKLLANAKHLHIMGSSLTSQIFIDFNLEAAQSIKSRGGTISFDPNIRKELLSYSDLSNSIEKFIDMSDLLLPSGDELTLLTTADDEMAAVDELLGRGISAIVHKKGANGATYHDSKRVISVEPFQVDEIDPTGAGDCFGAAFTTLWLRNVDALEALTIATATGGLAVTKKGPMEGICNLTSVQDFIKSNRKIS